MAGAPHSGGGGDGGGGEASSSPPVTAEAAEAAPAVEETMGMMMISSRMTHAPGGSGQGVKPRGGRTRAVAPRAPAMMRFIFMFCLHMCLRVSLADLWNLRTTAATAPWACAHERLAAGAPSGARLGLVGQRGGFILESLRLIKV